MNTQEQEWAPGSSQGPKDDQNTQEGIQMSDSHGSGLARTTDRATSHDAVPPRAKREEQKRAILWILTAKGPMTDHQLAHEYRKLRAQHNWPATQLDSVRKRRSELKNEGRVYDTGVTAGWGTGPASTVWAVVESEEAAA